MMPTIREDILEKFLQNLSKTDGFNDDMVEQVRQLFKDDKKPKAADLVKVFSPVSDKDLP